MNFFDFLWDLADRARRIFNFIWSLDYSFVHTEVFGLSLMDVASFLLGVLAFWEFCKWVFGLVGGALERMFQHGFSHVFSMLLKTVGHVMQRVWWTLLYLYARMRLRRKTLSTGVQLKRISSSPHSLPSGS